MCAQAESHLHLRKARELLDAAHLEAERDPHTAAASSAVLAGINAKDAICLRLTGRTSKADAHRSAVSELAAAGPAGKDLESTFRRLLSLKTAAQYHPDRSASPTPRRQSTGRRAWSTLRQTSSRDMLVEQPWTAQATTDPTDPAVSTATDLLMAAIGGL